MHAHNKLIEAQRVTWISTVVDLILGVGKVLGGLVANSTALVVDGIHSLSDLVTDIMILVVNHVSHQQPDDEHPYGHERFETLGTVLLGLILIAVAGGILVDGIYRMIDIENHQMPTSLALYIAGASIVVKEALFYYNMHVGKKLNSKILIANAWHSRSDSWSSVVVLVGVAGAMMGYLWFDVLAAIVVAFFVGKIGWELTWENAMELVDTALPAEETDIIKQEIVAQPGIIGVHNMRSRKMAGKVALDLHLEVDPYITVTEGHRLSHWVSDRLIEKFEHVNDVICHIDIEDYKDTEYDELTRHYPLRSEIESVIGGALPTWKHDINLQSMNLHYGHHGIEIELVLAHKCGAETIDSIRKTLETAPWYRNLSALVPAI
jgi:cation diffusion facilitator family transporter